jgi:D-ribose pyranase
MRKTATTINPALSRVISETGHTDLVVVTDAGLPIPPGSERIDLAYRAGAPAFLDVLDTVLAELVVEGATVSAEVAEKSPEVLDALRERFAGMGFEIELIPHVEFKKRTHGARAFVRSGEFTPYANVILHAGVAY